MSDTTPTSSKERDGRFVIGGKAGPGRPKGARSKLGEAFLEDLRDSWEIHGATALAKCAVSDPGQYCRIVASLMPRDLNLNVAVDAADFAERFRTACSLLGNPEPARLRRSLRVINHVR